MTYSISNRLSYYGFVKCKINLKFNILTLTTDLRLWRNIQSDLRTFFPQHSVIILMYLLKGYVGTSKHWADIIFCPLVVQSGMRTHAVPIQTCCRTSWLIQPFSSYLIPDELSLFPCPENSVVIWLGAKLILFPPSLKWLQVLPSVNELECQSLWKLREKPGMCWTRY
jgi:hypothetical protein